MNEVMNVILTRRSVRAFEKKRIPDHILDQILQAALYAPSGQGKQTWHFTAVCDRQMIQTLAQAIAKELGRDSYNFYDPEIIIIPSNLRDSRHGMEDNACALENIFLAAQSYGIGSCWINQLRLFCDQPEIRSILRSWNIPDDHTVYGIAALGYPAPDSTRPVNKIGQITVIH